jgi:hypothetical protein
LKTKKFRCQCGLEWGKSDSCAATGLMTINGKKYSPIPFHAETWTNERPDQCPGCGVKPGGIHHQMCSIEQCPVCGNRMLYCQCDKGSLSLFEKIKQGYKKLMWGHV